MTEDIRPGDILLCIDDRGRELYIQKGRQYYCIDVSGGGMRVTLMETGTSNIFFTFRFIKTTPQNTQNQQHGT